jgi:hypothetical protein
MPSVKVIEEKTADESMPRRGKEVMESVNRQLTVACNLFVGLLCKIDKT